MSKVSSGFAEDIPTKSQKKEKNRQRNENKEIKEVTRTIHIQEGKLYGIQ